MDSCHLRILIWSMKQYGWFLIFLKSTVKIQAVRGILEILVEKSQRSFRSINKKEAWRRWKRDPGILICSQWYSLNMMYRWVKRVKYDLLIWTSFFMKQRGNENFRILKVFEILWKNQFLKEVEIKYHVSKTKLYCAIDVWLSKCRTRDNLVKNILKL